MGKLKITFEAGLLIRGKVIRELKSAAFRNGLDIDIEEAKGLLDSDYRVTFTGADEKLLAFKPVLEEWMKNVS